MTRKTRFTALLTALAALVPATSASAITNGVADDGRHPYVGALVSYDEYGKFLICSGTLVAPKVFMTAAHCLVDEPNDLYVSFDETVGAPDVGEDVTLYHGQAVGHPRFVDETAPGETYDVAVVVLDEPVKGIRPALLPRVKLLRKLDRMGLEDDLKWTSVGYGREGFDPTGGEDGEGSFFGGGSRRFAASEWGSLEAAKLNLLQSETTGGSCRGDSGGPVLLGRTRIAVGIISDGDEFCREQSVNYRVDTKVALKFVERFIKRNRDRDDDRDDD